jgi:hypothetical protein
MIIPNAARAVVDIRKLRDYCLDPTHTDLLLPIVKLRDDK